MNTPEQIDRLEPHQVFVFGSNLAGRHGAGAAKHALAFGALYGIGIGPMGRTYAVPTKGRQLEVLPLERIKLYVGIFLVHVLNHPDKQFLVTRIGCGLAGYAPAQIGPMFHPHPPNVVLPKEFLP